MNCQIIKIESDILHFDAVSTKIDKDYQLGSVVLINRIDITGSENQKIDKNQAKSFGKIVELSLKSIKIKLFKPKLYRLGKIVKLYLIKSESLFLPQILNKTIVFGEVFQVDSEQSFEFIPTVLLGEDIIQGQKIGYINTQTTTKTNFKYWILARKSGVTNNIKLGNFKLGEQIAIINKTSVILEHQNKNIKTQKKLFKDFSQHKNLIVQCSDLINDKNNLQIKTGQSNLILGSSNKFFDSIYRSKAISPEQLENYILIFVTDDENFVADSQYKTITFLNKHNLIQCICMEIDILAINICETGYSVIIISTNSMDLKCLGQYKTVNEEFVSITHVALEFYTNLNKNHFENILDTSL